MDDLTVIARGRPLSLSRDLTPVLRALDEDGYLILQNATQVEPVAPGSFDFLQRDIILNRAVKTILFSTQKEGYRITTCRPYKASDTCPELGRDEHWQRMASSHRLLGAMCYHLGGDINVGWKVRIRRNDDTEEIEIRAKGGDIFICHHWLLRSRPFLESRQTNEVYQIVISYLWTEYSQRGAPDPITGKKILEQFPDECCLIDRYVVWKA